MSRTTEDKENVRASLKNKRWIRSAKTGMLDTQISEKL